MSLTQNTVYMLVNTADIMVTTLQTINDLGTLFKTFEYLNIPNIDISIGRNDRSTSQKLLGSSS